MNQLNIIGGLTRDPESRTTQSGKQVCTFTVGVNRRNDREKSDFFRVNAWGELGNNCAKYLSKGKKVCVIGTVSTRDYTTSKGEAAASLEVTADEVEFLSPRDEGQAQREPEKKVDEQSGYEQVELETDDLPF